MNTTIKILMLAFVFVMTNLNAQDRLETDDKFFDFPGDNLDLYATLDLFQNSKTIEEFEASLNDEKTGINNLDLNVDNNVDFIKVITQKEGDNFAFILQVDVYEKETQDVAVILVSKDGKDDVTLQIIGDEDLYGNDYVIEPRLEVAAVTTNPAYSGTETYVAENEPARVVVIKSQPIVRFVYSPYYAPYYSPYYYGHYPSYYRPYRVILLTNYSRKNLHHRKYYYGGRNSINTVVIRNNNIYYNYVRNRKTSITVNKNRSVGKYKRINAPAKKSTQPAKKSTKKASTKAAAKSNKKQTTKQATKQKRGGKKERK